MTTPAHLSETRFHDLPLHPALLQALDDLGYARCTPIQAATLPRALAGADLAGQAQTGTGKTVAFLLAVFDGLLRRDATEGRPRALVLAPTRELAIQIARDAEALAKHAGLKIGLAYGGADYDRQREHIASGVDVLIGTPGRIIDFQKQHVFPMKYLEAVVLDEADRMFDLGFIADIRYLLRRAPPPASRRNYLFSATLSQRVLELAFEHMNAPEKVTIEPERMTAHRLAQSLIHVSNDDKLPLLAGLVKTLAPARSIVFVNTKRAAELVEFRLRRRGLDARTISGDVPQAKRERLLERFKKGELAVLVATDVAARGLHIPEVSHVFNYDLPQDVEDYVHRIGRTARAGAAGAAISLACESYVYSLPEIEKYIGQKLGPFDGDIDELIRLGSEKSAAADDGETSARDDGRQMRAERDGGSGGRGGRGGRRGEGRGPRPVHAETYPDAGTEDKQVSAPGIGTQGESRGVDAPAGERAGGRGGRPRGGEPPRRIGQDASGHGGWIPRPGSRVWQRPVPAAEPVAGASETLAESAPPSPDVDSTRSLDSPVSK